MEGQPDSAIPFLDVLRIRKETTLTTKVYRSLTVRLHEHRHNLKEVLPEKFKSARMPTGRVIG
jgi:hypothetical protein